LRHRRSYPPFARRGLCVRVHNSKSPGWGPSAGARAATGGAADRVRDPAADHRNQPKSTRSCA